MPSSAILFSVIIGTWNRKDDLSGAIDSVVRQKGVEKEIIVIDNDSSDGTDHLIAEYQGKYPYIRYIRMNKNTGVIAPRNKGVAEAKGGIIFILDDDAELADEEAFLTVASKFEETGADVITAKIINFHTREDEGFMFAHNRDLYHDKSFFAFGFNGSSTFFRKYVFDKIGYFDETFFRQGEELDFSYRMSKAGLLTYYYADVVVCHKANPHRQTSSAINYFSFRNTLTGIWKNLPFFEAMAMSMINVILYTGISVRSLSFLFPLRSLMDFVRAIPYTVRSRHPLNRKEARRMFYLMTHPLSRREEFGGEATISDYMAYYVASRWLCKRPGKVNTSKGEFYENN